MSVGRDRARLGRTSLMRDRGGCYQGFLLGGKGAMAGVWRMSQRRGGKPKSYREAGQGSRSDEVFRTWVVAEGGGTFQAKQGLFR